MQSCVVDVHGRNDAGYFAKRRAEEKATLQRVDLVVGEMLTKDRDLPKKQNLANLVGQSL